MHTKILAVLLVGLVAVAAASGQTQGATPTTEGLFAGLGLPEIVLTATDDQLTLSRTEVPAGRYLVTLDNHSWDDLWVEFLRFGAEPPIGDASCRMGIPPECFTWYTLVYHPGGVSAQAPQAILDLRAGEYGLWGPGILSEAPAARLIVIGERDAPVNGPEPMATTLTVSEGEGDTGFTVGIDGELQPGPQLIKIVNTTEQLLAINATQYPGPITVEQVATMETFNASGRITPPPEALDPERFQIVVSTSPQSPGAQQWLAIDLDPGQVYFSGLLLEPITLETSSGRRQVADIVEPVAGS